MIYTITSNKNRYSSLIILLRYFDININITINTSTFITLTSQQNNMHILKYTILYSYNFKLNKYIFYIFIGSLKVCLVN